ncbi:hypothetical protein CTAYLR_006744 [Chrysophaeum taylorii]|uniref:SNF2 super family n=1 Tax=Chrysophaeum taylorii TaxID=2483200 RepID=A0AAD7UC84_9STRA|nr:hypothetical protein CTAYLR_006744 [Chrysophaeum taylorii]
MARPPFDAGACRLAMLEKLMPFQREGVAFGERANGRLLIGDEMGLGKSAQAICLVLAYAGEFPALIVCPASLRYSWAHELEKWLPSMPPGEVCVAKGRADVEAVSRKRCSFCIVTYSLFAKGSKVAEAARKRAFRVVVVDESHYLRTRDSQRTQLLAPIMANAARLVLLSGTPALARPVELYPQLSALDDANKNLFGTYSEFTKSYCNAHRGRFGWDVSGCSNADKLHALLSNVMVRRLKRNVLTQLPAKRRQMVVVEGTNAAAEAMKRLGDARAAVAAAVGKKSWASEFRALSEAWQLSGIAKVQSSAAYVVDLVSGSTSKLLVFAHHKAVVEGLHSELLRKEIGTIRIDGATPPKERQRLVDQFQTNPDVRAGLLSVTAAGEGLTLTAADAVVFAELHWTPGVMCQAEDRAHRIGLTHPINVHYLVVRDPALSLDSHLWTAIARKVATVGRTIDGEQDASLDATETEFTKDLVGFFAAEDLATNRRGGGGGKPLVEGDIRGFFAPKKKRPAELPPPAARKKHLAAAASSLEAPTTKRKLSYRVSRNTGRVQAFDRESDGFLASLDPRDIVVSNSASGVQLGDLPDDLLRGSDARDFLAAWFSLRAVDRDGLSDKIVSLPLRVPTDNNPKEDECFDRGRAAIFEAGVCGWCEAKLDDDDDGGGARFCSWDHACEYSLRKPNNSKAVRAQLFALEHGVCQLCGRDAHALYVRAKALEPPERFQLLLSEPGFAPSASNKRRDHDRRLTAPVEGDFWQADHILPVAEGGGCCSLRNFRTLCVPCHKAETEKLRLRLRARKNKDAARGSHDLRSFLRIDDDDDDDDDDD